MDIKLRTLIASHTRLLGASAVLIIIGSILVGGYFLKANAPKPSGNTELESFACCTYKDSAPVCNSNIKTWQSCVSASGVLIKGGSDDVCALNPCPALDKSAKNGWNCSRNDRICWPGNAYLESYYDYSVDSDSQNASKFCSCVAGEFSKVDIKATKKDYDNYSNYDNPHSIGFIPKKVFDYDTGDWKYEAKIDKPVLAYSDFWPDGYQWEKNYWETKERNDVEEAMKIVFCDDKWSIGYSTLNTYCQKMDYDRSRCVAGGYEGETECWDGTETIEASDTGKLIDFCKCASGSSGFRKILAVTTEEGKKIATKILCADNIAYEIGIYPYCEPKQGVSNCNGSTNEIVCWDGGGLHKNQVEKFCRCATIDDESSYGVGFGEGYIKKLEDMPDDYMSYISINNDDNWKREPETEYAPLTNVVVIVCGDGREYSTANKYCINEKIITRSFSAYYYGDASPLAGGLPLLGELKSDTVGLLCKTSPNSSNGTYWTENGCEGKISVGSDVIVSAVANSNGKFKQWKDSEGRICPCAQAGKSNNAKCEFEMPDYNTSCQAVFKKLQPTPSPSPSSSPSPSP